MSDVRANPGVPVLAQFGGVTTPSACAPVVVNSATGFIYTLKTGDVVVAAGSGGTVTSVGFTGGLISVASGTTAAALTVSGTSGGIPYFSGSTTWASSGVLASNAIVIGGGAGFTPATTTTGTGVLTALGVNVGTAGSFVANGGALGTPSSGTATNLSGTASGLTSGTVTTNANLTGPITSAGNATAIASQTGTGSKFVVDTSPTLVTPILGVAAATSINFGQTALNWNQEGSWTPSDGSGASLAFSVTSDGCYYRRIGSMVFIFFDFAFPVTADGSSNRISGLPFTSKTGTHAVGGGAFLSTSGVTYLMAVVPNSTTMDIYTTGAIRSTNASLSGKTFNTPTCVMYSV